MSFKDGLYLGSVKNYEIDKFPTYFTFCVLSFFPKVMNLKQLHRKKNNGDHCIPIFVRLALFIVVCLFDWLV